MTTASAMGILSEAMIAVASYGVVLPTLYLHIAHTFMRRITSHSKLAKRHEGRNERNDPSLEVEIPKMGGEIKDLFKVS